MLSSLNFEIGWMARELGFHRRNIYEVVIVGNSTMRDILFGIDVQSIGEKPYKSMVEHEMLRGERNTTAIHTTASELGLRVFPKAHMSMAGRLLPATWGPMSQPISSPSAWTSRTK